MEASQTGFQGVPSEDYNYVKVHRLNKSLPNDKSHYLGRLSMRFTLVPIPTHYPGPAVVYVIEGR